MRAVAAKVRSPSSTTEWDGPTKATVKLEKAHVKGTVDASVPGMITLTVSGPSILMSINERMALREIDNVVRERLGDRYLGIDTGRKR